MKTNSYPRTTVEVIMGSIIMEHGLRPTLDANKILLLPIAQGCMQTEASCTIISQSTIDKKWPFTLFNKECCQDSMFVNVNTLPFFRVILCDCSVFLVHLGLLKIRKINSNVYVMCPDCILRE